MVDDIRKIVETEVQILRHIPYDHYTFLLHNTSERGGGLEHLNSTALQYPPGSYKPREKYENFLELVAHEPDGVAHAQHRGAPRTACGERATEERFAWPTASRCPDCVVALGLAGEPR